jgi:hypothetical protein
MSGERSVDLPDRAPSCLHCKQPEHEAGNRVPGGKEEHGRQHRGGCRLGTGEVRRPMISSSPRGASKLMWANLHVSRFIAAAHNEIRSQPPSFA